MKWIYRQVWWTLIGHHKADAWDEGANTAEYDRILGTSSTNPYLESLYGRDQ